MKKESLTLYEVLSIWDDMEKPKDMLWGYDKVNIIIQNKIQGNKRVEWEKITFHAYNFVFIKRLE